MAVDNLKNIDGTWYVRVAIPKDVRSAFGNRTEFIKSLKTGRCGFHAIRTLSPPTSGHPFHAHSDRQSERSDAGLHC